MRKHTSATASSSKKQGTFVSIGTSSGSLGSNNSPDDSGQLTTMANEHLKFTSLTTGSETKSILEMKNISRKARAECELSESTSHTQFYKQARGKEVFERITTNEFFSVSESISGSTNTFRCVHGPKGKIYTQKGLLKRNTLKELDPIPTEPKWTQSCPPAYNWEITNVLAFIVQDPTCEHQNERINMHLNDFIKISSNGYKIEYLNNVCVIISYLVESLPSGPDRSEILISLLKNMNKPVLLNTVFDITKYFEDFRNYMGFMGYLLMRLGEDSMFDEVSKALIWHLYTPDRFREKSWARQCHSLAAAAPVLYEAVTKMLAVATSHRFPTFLTLAMILACDSADNCLELMKRNILENLFYRFNPYFPDRLLPVYDINPADPQDINLKLGDSGIHMSTTMSLMLILIKTIKDHLDKDPNYTLLLPSPDDYAQRCFIWAFRYECRARDHRNERKILTVISHVLVHCFGSRLKQFSEFLMPDILTLSVATEVPPRDDWTGIVNFNTAQDDVQFKKLLIYFSTTLLKVFPHNKAMVESRHYILGLMYLLDPSLSCLRSRWPPSLFAELRKTSLQALVCCVPILSPNLVQDYGLIRRIMWYIEWFSESPYELAILYWCVRLLHVAIYNRKDKIREKSINTLFNTHGIIILIKLCYTLLEQKTPPVEKAQGVIALCLRMMTSAVEYNKVVSCCVYPNIQWPSAAGALATRMMNVVLYSMDKHIIISDRWLIALLNFVWEAIVWKTEFREKFVAEDGIYRLLDIVTMTRPPVQCIALAVVCDATKAGHAVGQLVTWRADVAADQAYPNVVKQGSTIATLLASIFRDECHKTGVELDVNGVIKDMESPIMSMAVKQRLDNHDKAKSSLTSPLSPPSLIASELFGSRMSKAYAILDMLSEDLEQKVCLADETYNLYKNIQLNPEDETVLVLCTHFLTMKLNEVWVETKTESIGYLRHDEAILEEFLQIGRGWAKEIKRLQEEVLQKHKKKEADAENSLYEFLARVRLNISLDALQEVQCVARSADRACMTHALLQDAVRAHHRRSASVKQLRATIIKTYEATLDDKNITGQNIKVLSTHPKDKSKPILDFVSSST